MCPQKWDNIMYQDPEDGQEKVGIIYAKDAEGENYIVMERGTYEIRIISKEDVIET